MSKVYHQSKTEIDRLSFPDIMMFLEGKEEDDDPSSKEGVDPLPGESPLSAIMRAHAEFRAKKEAGD